MLVQSVLIDIIEIVTRVSGDLRGWIVMAINTMFDPVTIMKTRLAGRCFCCGREMTFHAIPRHAKGIDFHEVATTCSGSRAVKPCDQYDRSINSCIKNIDTMFKASNHCPLNAIEGKDERKKAEILVHHVAWITRLLGEGKFEIGRAHV